MFERKTTESQVNVNLSASNLDADSYIARVPRNPLDIDNIVSDITAGNPSLDPYVIMHAAELIKKQILSYIKEGKSVNILNIATVYAAPKTVVPRVNPQVDDLPALALKFAPSKEAIAALAAVKPASFMIKTNEPAIKRVVSLKDGDEGGTLHKKYLARVEGENLKLVGDDAAVFFVPADGEGAPSGDEGAWIKAADTSYLPLNFPKTLEFYIPDAAEEGVSYFVAVRTRYNRSGKERKQAVTGFSSLLTVAS